MERKRIVIVTASEHWQGLYIDGVLAVEGRTLTPVDVLSALGINHAGFDVDKKWLASLGDTSLPMNLKDVVHE